MLVDQLNDTDMSVLKEKVANLQGISERLEKVASVDISSREELSKEAFAWPEEKLFPIYTPEHAMLSSVYLEGNDDVPGFVKEACEEACALFGIDVSIGGLEKRASESTLGPSDFLLPAAMKLPVVDSDTFAMSRSVLEKTAETLPVDDMVSAYSILIKKASELGLSVSDRERVLGLDGHIVTKVAADEIMDRFLETGDEGYMKVAELLTGNVVVSKEKIASIVFDVIDLDARNNFEKTAAETIRSIVSPGSFSNHVIVGDLEVPYDKVASIDAGDWTDVLPVSVVESLFEDGDLNTSYLNEIVDSMSGIEKEAIASFININRSL